MIFLGIDLGASSLKAVLLNTDGVCVGEAAHPLTTHHPAPAYAEQDPAEWRTALIAVLQQLAQKHRAEMQNLAGIAFTGGAHIGVVTDARNIPLRPAIMWSDQRATAEARALPPDRTLHHCHNHPNPTWTLPQLMWREAHDPTPYTHLRFAKDWLRDQILDHPANTSDRGEAVGALLYDFATEDWSDALCAYGNVPRSARAQLVASTAIIGETDAKWHEITGIKKAVPIIQGSIDTSVELLCCDTPDPNNVIVKLASAGVVTRFTPTPDPHPPISLYPFLDTPLHYHAAGMSHCAAALDWLRAVWLGDMSFADMEACARDTEAGAAGVIFHPYLNGERAPHWSPDLRAQLSGMTRATHRGHIARAGFEGVSFALYDILRDMDAQFGCKTQQIELIGGGARSAFWAQMLADITQCETLVPRYGSAAIGAARLVANALGKPIATDTAPTRFAPNRALAEIYDARFADYQAITQNMMG